MKSASLIASVEATKLAPVSTWPVEVIVMPLGFTRNTLPVACKVPASNEAFGPVTMLSVAAPASGWAKVSLLVKQTSARRRARWSA